jgi:hypothetical protein
MTNVSFKKVAFAVALALGGSQAAMAFDGAGAGGNGQNGNLIVTVFDTVLGHSLMQVLQHPSVGDGTINYTEFTEAAMTPDAGLTLNFNVDLSFFTSNGSNLSNLGYTVIAVDSSGVVNSSGGQQGAIFTAPVGAVPSMFTNLITTMQTQYGVMATANGGVSALISTKTNFEAGYAGATSGGQSWGATFGGALASGGAASLDTALGFYYATKVSATSSTPAPTVAFQNADGLAATWNLSSAGLLTYVSPPAGVPLPAAVWLLLSGIGGLGVMGRRRASAVAAA